MQTKIAPQNNTEESLLSSAQTYFIQQVAPQAALLDQDTEALKQSFKKMGDHGLLGLNIPQQWGGKGASELTYRRFQILIARYSGALAFLQTQHQGAIAKLIVSPNTPLKQTYLPLMATGEMLVGVGFSQLRRQGKPLMQATPVTGGYLLTGEVPWITGWNIFEEFIIGATLPTSEALYGIIPFREEPGLHFSQPMELAVMGVTNTVKATLTDWFLPCDRLVSLHPPGTVQESDRKNVLHHGFFALGCAQAGLDILEQACQQKSLPFLQPALDSLHNELMQCTQGMLASLSPDRVLYEKRLQLRGWAINLASRCSQGAVIASSGGANFLSHPAQRVYREALVFTVLGQTSEVMEETLKQLVSEEF
ncbi:acyl-CoA dehydrogenase domain protein [Rippkaea orientalis PCC 8801]|uniref:Acyl-CoA dehydrogenase domain protein n=1 Tax=Rippkaea orientalis (strain PCC 8801 / RF-1) TaxID=41431 RepID=B7JWE7_RIPO1|nr:acyl-CoA dehydrogenase family protein [Rippkaea orientalis]ACK66992.1 acyl-CoA dehydrogenase domain protein [Rippkaea orientalis PCC 8801]